MGILTQIQNVGFLQSLFHAKAIQRAERFKQLDPLTAQRRILSELLDASAATQFGKEYSFARVKDAPFDVAYRYFKSRVPIRSYQELVSDYFYRNQPTVIDGKSIPNLENITNVGDFNPAPKKKLKHPAVWLAQAE